MGHSLQLICILIILVTNQSVYGSTHALIGSYSQLNPKDCGITRFVPILDNSCFKWSKNIIAGMKGKNATQDEVPWVAHLHIKVSGRITFCSGSFIGDQWLIIAAHCIESSDPEDYTIYAGIDSYADTNKTYIARAKQLYRHPYYSSNNNPPFNDIGLIKLDRSIKSIKSNKNNHFKSICLPKKNIFNIKQELALFSGWGMVDRDQWPLQVGIKKIYPSDDYSFWYSSNVITAVKIDDKTLICKGDSGATLWQYDMERAVLIGVNCWGSIDNKTLCDFPNRRRGSNLLVRVSKYIDWIKNVTQLK